MKIRFYFLLFLCFFMVLSPITGFAYSNETLSKNVFNEFVDDAGKGEFVDANYRLYSKGNSFTKMATLKDAARNSIFWECEVEIVTMDNAAPGLYFIQRNKGIGVEIHGDGLVSVKFMEIDRSNNIFSWLLTEKKVAGIHAPVRLGISYNVSTTEFTVSLNGANVLSGKGEDSAAFSLLVDFESVGIKTINDLLNRQGYCEFGKISLNTKK